MFILAVAVFNHSIVQHSTVKFCPIYFLSGKNVLFDAWVILATCYYIPIHVTTFGKLSLEWKNTSVDATDNIF